MCVSDTNSTWQGVQGRTEYSDHNSVVGLIIEDNTLDDLASYSISLAASNMGNRFIR